MQDLMPPSDGARCGVRCSARCGVSYSAGPRNSGPSKTLRQDGPKQSVLSGPLRRLNESPAMAASIQPSTVTELRASLRWADVAELDLSAVSHGPMGRQAYQLTFAALTMAIRASIWAFGCKLATAGVGCACRAGPVSAAGVAVLPNPPSDQFNGVPVTLEYKPMPRTRITMTHPAFSRPPDPGISPDALGTLIVTFRGAAA